VNEVMFRVVFRQLDSGQERSFTCQTDFDGVVPVGDREIERRLKGYAENVFEEVARKENFLLEGELQLLRRKYEVLVYYPLNSNVPLGELAWE
jgi:hypothetical protein